MGAQESRLLQEKGRVQFHKIGVGRILKIHLTRISFYTWNNSMMRTDAISCFLLCKMKSKSWEFLKREEEEERGERKEKGRKNEKREDRRTDEDSYGLASCIHSTVSDSFCLQNFWFSLISMLLPTLRLESYCRQTSFFFYCCFYLEALSHTPTSQS